MQRMLLLALSFARLQFRDATTLGRTQAVGDNADAACGASCILHRHAQAAAAAAAAANGTAAASGNASAAGANASADAAPPDSYALDRVASVLTLYGLTEAHVVAIRPALEKSLANMLQVDNGEVEIASIVGQPLPGAGNATGANGTNGTNGTSANGTAGANGTANGTGNGTAAVVATLVVRKLRLSARALNGTNATAFAGPTVDVKVAFAAPGLLKAKATEAAEKLAAAAQDPAVFLHDLVTEVAAQQLAAVPAGVQGQFANGTLEEQIVQLPIQGCSDLDAQDTGRFTDVSSPASCQDLQFACSGPANQDVRDACPLTCRLCAGSDAPVSPPPSLPAVPSPEHALAGQVGLHTGAPQQVAESTSPELLFQANTTFVLQLVGNEAAPGSLIGMPGDLLDPKSDKCLTVGDFDDLGGRALSFTHCLHQDQDYEPSMVPAEMQFYLLQDGRIAWAVNASSSSANCILQKSCNGAMVYDVGDCNSPEAAILQVRASVAQSAERTKYIGTPLQGVASGGGVFTDLHGPFQMYTHCDGVQTSHGCMRMVPKGGWTKLASQYLGPSSFTAEDPTPLPPLPVKDMTDQVASGNEQGAADALSAAAFGTTKALAGVQTGLDSTGDSDRCGTWITDGDRLFAWWYFVSASKPEPESASNATNATASDANATASDANATASGANATALMQARRAR